MSPLLIEELAKQRQIEIAEEFSRIHISRQTKKRNSAKTKGLKIRFLYFIGRLLISMGNRILNHCPLNIDDNCLNTNNV